jgi:excisionase family DNA binding protein
VNDKEAILPNVLLLTPREAAERLRCSERKLERHRLTGDGPPFVKFGAAVRYPLDELNAWLAAHMRRSTSEPIHSETAGPKLETGGA